jgi:hypothetical protein
MFPYWFKNLFSKKSRPAPRRRPARVPVGLEELESRFAPAVTVKILNGVLTAQAISGFNTVTVDHLSSGFARINGHNFSDARYNSIQIIGGAGGTQTNIHGNVKPLTVFGASANDVVNLGDTSNQLQGIKAGVLVEDEKGFSGTLNINDQGDTTGSTVTLSTLTRLGDTSLGQLMGLTAPIAWDYGDTSAVNLKLGPGAGTVDVLGTGTTTNVINSGNANIVVGSNGTAESIGGALNLENENPAAKDTVLVLDQNDPAIPIVGPGIGIAHNVSVGTVTRPGDSSLGTLVGLNAPITWDYADTSSVTIDLGAVASEVHVNGTGPLITNISFAAPNVTVEVGNSNVAANILGTLNLQTPAGGATVNILDNNDSQGRTATLAAVSRVNQSSLGQLSGLGSGVITWDSLGTPQVFVVGGSGTDTFNIQDTVVPTIITANGPAIMNVGGLGGSIAGIQSPLLLRNNSGPNNTVNINSQNDSFTTTAVLNAVGGDSSTGGGVFSVQGLSSDIFFDKANTSALTLNLASNIVVVDNTVVATTIFSQGNATIDVAHNGTGQLAGIQANLTLENEHGKHSKDTINIDDSNDHVGQTYSMVRVPGDESGNTFEQFSSSAMTGLITWDNADTRLVTVFGGSGDNVFDVTSTGAATTINGGPGHDTFNVPPFGTQGSLGANIVGRLTLNGNSVSTLNLNDLGDGASETFHFSIPAFGPATLTLDSTPAFDLVFNNMGTVNLFTNLFSTVDDPSFTVHVILPPTP